MIRILVALVLGMSCVVIANATEYMKQASLNFVGRQATRPIQPSTDDHDFLSFGTGPTWTVVGGSGGGTCNDGGAVLPANDPMMRAIALAAIASGAKVEVHVDSTLPVVASYCQIAALWIVGS